MFDRSRRSRRAIAVANASATHFQVFNPRSSVEILEVNSDHQSAQSCSSTTFNLASDLHAPQRSHCLIQQSELHSATASNPVVAYNVPRVTVETIDTSRIDTNSSQIDPRQHWKYSSTHLPFGENIRQHSLHSPERSSSSYQACISGVSDVRKLFHPTGNAGVPYSPMARGQVLMEAAADVHRMIERALEEDRKNLVWLGLPLQERKTLEELKMEMEEVWREGDRMFQEAHQEKARGNIST